MVQTVCCSCTKQKLRNDKVYFCTDKNLCEAIDKNFVVPCPRHPYFKEIIGSRLANVPSRLVIVKVWKKENVVTAKLFVSIEISWLKRSTLDIISISRLALKLYILNNIWWILRACCFSISVVAALKFTVPLTILTIYPWSKKIPYGFNL